MSDRRFFVRLAVPIALAAAIALVWRVRPLDLRTSLGELAGDCGRGVPQTIVERMSADVPIVVSAKDFQKADAAATALEEAIRRPNASGESVASCCISVSGMAGNAFSATMNFVATNRAGLVSAAAREALASPEGRAKLARRHAKRLYSDPSPTLFPPTLDPFGLAEDFVKSQTGEVAGWSPRGNWIVAETNGLVHILFNLVLKPDVACDTDALMAFERRLDSALKTVRGDETSAVACGTPVHTARAAARCKRQIGWLSAVSLVFIAVLSVFAFRSVRWIPVLAESLVASALAGSLALLAAFRSVHLMTFVFGTTVLGLVVDYSFHMLMRKRGSHAATTRNLLVSFATTETSLVPLALSSMPVLRQSAVFLGTGLATALAMVLFLYPEPPEHAVPAANSTQRHRSRATLFLAFAVIALALIPGLARLRFESTAQMLYRPPSDLAAAERFLAERSGAADAEGGIIVISGGTLDDRLAKEESLVLPPKTPRLSDFLPSLATRRKAADDVEKLYAEQGEAQAALLGLESLVPPPEPREWRGDDMPAAVSQRFLFGNDLAIVTSKSPAIPLPDGVTFWQPRKTLTNALSKWTRETRHRLLAALALLLALLVAIYRRAAIAVLAPSIVALAVVGSALGLRGDAANLFHLLASFLLVGISIDYSVFLRGGGMDALRPALCSLATSLVGFGLLVFVDFPVVHDIGFTLALGLPVAFATAFALARTGGTQGLSATEPVAWPFGMEMLLFIYRVFGLRVLHLFSAASGLVIWTFSAKVRHASPRAAKLVAFTRSLSDKFIVMAEGRRPPRVVTDGSPDADAFVADVQAGRGVFILSSHVGTIEVLASLGECRATFHAWMDVARTSIFNSFYLHHARRQRVKIHPISEIGMGTAFFAGDALERGDCLVMAGDRGRGAFRFAHSLGAPVYFVACVFDGPVGYKAIVRRLPENTSEMESVYQAMRSEVAAAHPDEVFEWTPPVAEKGDSR